MARVLSTGRALSTENFMTYKEYTLSNIDYAYSYIPVPDGINQWSFYFYRQNNENSDLPPLSMVGIQSAGDATTNVYDSTPWYYRAVVWNTSLGSRLITRVDFSVNESLFYNDENQNYYRLNGFDLTCSLKYLDNGSEVESDAVELISGDSSSDYITFTRYTSHTYEYKSLCLDGRYSISYPVTTQEEATTGMISLLEGTFNSMSGLLNTSLIGSITIGSVIAIPLSLIIITLVLRLVKK